MNYSLVDQWLEITCPYVDQANLTSTCNEYEWELLAVEVRERSHEVLIDVALLGIVNLMKYFIGLKHQESQIEHTDQHMAIGQLKHLNDLFLV